LSSQLPFAAAIADPTLLAFAVLGGFVIGICGQIIRSRPLILTGIFVIGVISLYAVVAGEVVSLGK
jgi:MFS-type transporter involved in bile tolerance (Atg22 family)